MYDEDKKKIVEPAIEFFEEGTKWQEKAIVLEEESITGENNYAILRTTENGKWVRGNLLFYKFHGVEIYTDINNIILVDVLNRSLLIREHSEVIKQIAPKSPERKQYIILYVDMGYDENETEIPLRWESYIGRQYAYQALLSNLPVIDLDRSKVLVDNVALKDSLSVRKFLLYLKNAGIVSEYDFDLEDSYEYEESDING